MMKRQLLPAMVLGAMAVSPAFGQYTLTTLASFNGANGDDPAADLTLSGNTFYSTTVLGGANDDGTVFALTVPEPASASLLAIGSLILLARCRRRQLFRDETGGMKPDVSGFIGCSG